MARTSDKELLCETFCKTEKSHVVVSTKHYRNYFRFYLVKIIGLLILVTSTNLNLNHYAELQTKKFIQNTQRKIFQFHCNQHPHAFIQYLYHQILFYETIFFSFHLNTNNKTYKMYTKNSI